MGKRLLCNEPLPALNRAAERRLPVVDVLAAAAEAFAFDCDRTTIALFFEINKGAPTTVFVAQTTGQAVGWLNVCRLEAIVTGFRGSTHLIFYRSVKNVLCLYFLRPYCVLHTRVTLFS
jgi:hypothetical protein